VPQTPLRDSNNAWIRGGAW